MTAEEVTVVEVAEKEAVAAASSSSKVEIVVGKDEEERKKEEEDLSNGANGRTVKVDTDADTDVEGDGSYVFVNGNEAVNGDPAASDLENNGIGVGGEDQGVENLEVKVEAKSESDSAVKDLEGEDGSCIEIAYQDKESVELCHVEGPVVEEKPGDLAESGPVSAINVEDGVSEASAADQNGVSESPKGVSDSNGDGLADAIAKHTVSEDAVVDFSAKQSDEFSSVSVSDSNGGSLANDSVKDSVVDSRSKENEDSEAAVADDGGCNGDGLTNDSAKDTVSEAVVDTSYGHNGASELPDDGVHSVSVSDSNEDVLPNVSAQDTVSEAVVVDSGDEHNDGVPVSVSDGNGDGLPADSVEDSKPDQNDDSVVVEAEAYSPDPASNDNGDRPKQNGFSEMPETMHPDVVPGNELVQGEENLKAVDEVHAEGGLELEHNSERGLPLEADTNLLKETVRDSISGERGEALQDDHTRQNISETVVIDDSFDSSQISQGQSSEIIESAPSPVTNEHENLTVQRDVSDTAADLNIGTGASVDVVENSPSQASLENVTVEAEIMESAPSPVTNERENLIVQRDVTDTTSDLNISTGASADVAESSPSPASVENVSVEGEIVESAPSPVTNEHENLTVQRDVSDTTTDLNIGTEASADVAESSTSPAPLENGAVEVGVNDTRAEALPSSSVDDEKAETEVVKSDEHSKEDSNSHHVENSEVEIKVESIDDDTKSTCSDNCLKSETKISSDSIVSEEAGVSNGLAECDSSEPVTVGDKDEELAEADVQKDSSMAAPLGVDEKALPAAENSSDVSDRAIHGSDGILHESEVTHSDTNSNEQKSAVISGGIQFGSIVDDDKTCKEPEAIDEVEKKKPFYYLIRVPRYDDENLKEKIRLAQVKVDEKTQSRDAIRAEMQSQRAACKEYGDNFDAAISQERVARDLLRSKRQEIESIQSVINIDDIDGRIRNMEHMIQHETLPLKEEKQYIREIKQLKQVREQLASNRAKQDDVQQGLDQKDQIEKRLKSLKKEADQLRDNLQKAEAATKVAKKKFYDENGKIEKLLEQFKAADDIRQEAYAQLQSLKKQSYEKNKSFWQYRDASKTANELALKGDKQALENLCVNQVESLMDLWNNNDEFRKEYVRCNVRSTLRRLRTLDGRALGPNEEPPVIPKVVNERVAKDHSVSSSNLEERTLEKVAPAKAEKENEKPVAKALEQKNLTSKSEKSVKSAPPASVPATASTRDETVDAREEKPKRTKEEEELARKEEELRKEEEAAKLREQRRLEEIAKAKEALERKRRIAEKAQARAALRAQKEAEQKEKEREKRQRKKERRKVAASGAGDATVTDEVEPAPASETPAETPKESETKEKPVTVAKRPQKPSQFTKQTKAKSIPPPLRNRGKRRMQPWMWVLLTTLVIFALFLVGNSNFFFNFGLHKFKF